MPDNQSVSSTPYDVATDKVTYSGDADRNVQLSRIVAVTGAEGSKTVVENMPASLGQKAMAASFPVTLPSDADPIGITGSIGVVGVVLVATDTGDTVAVTDNAGSLTVDAPVATPVFVRLSDGTSAITTLPVSAASLPLPAGAATEANQTTEIGHLLNTSAATGTVGDAIASVGASGTVSAKLRRVTQGLEDLKAGITALPLPSGAATAANQATEITALQLLDDAVAVLGTDTYTEATTKGLTVGAVRRDADTTLVGTTNEIGPLQMDANGRLKVEAFSGETLPVSGTVTANAGSGTQAVSLAALPALVAGTANIGDVDVATIAAGDNNIGNVDIVTMPNVTIGTMAALVAGSAAIGKLAANSGVDIGDVDVISSALPTGAATAAKQDTEITSLQLLDDVVFAEDAVAASGDKGIPMLAVRRDSAVTTTSTDGDYNQLSTDIQGALWVSTRGNAAVHGEMTHGSSDTNNPVKIGSKAASALPTAVETDDRANAISDLFGRLLVSHIDPAMQITKAFNATTTQTGIDVWDPAAGKKIAITSVVIGTYGTTAARVILWFGDNADTTYSAGTDQVLLIASFAPSATAKPGLVFTPAVPIFCTTADRELHITTDAGISIDVTVHGYEY